MNGRRILKAVGVILLVLVLPLVAGYFVSPYVVPTPEVAVIRVEGEIWSYYTAYVHDALQKAENDPAIRAVVLDIASPGGEVTASEDLYFDILKLRESKPVIASVRELAASGAYYIASAADVIYAKPASEVGNIGVISYLPDPDLVDEYLLTTGPFKLSGGPQVGYLRKLEMLKDTFVAAILAQRADRLTVGPEVLSRGEIYLGLEAQRMGLVDELGSQADAIAEAARMARIRHYRVTDRSPELPEEEFAFEIRRGTTAATVAAVPKNLPPGFYYRYIEPAH